MERHVVLLSIVVHYSRALILGLRILVGSSGEDGRCGWQKGCVGGARGGPPSRRQRRRRRPQRCRSAKRGRHPFLFSRFFCPFLPATTVLIRRQARAPHDLHEQRVADVSGIRAQVWTGTILTTDKKIIHITNPNV